MSRIPGGLIAGQVEDSAQHVGDSFGPVEALRVEAADLAVKSRRKLRRVPLPPFGLVPDVLGRLRLAGAGDIPVVVGGIIPPADAASLRSQGVAAIFTPADFGITAIIGRIVEVIRLAHKLQPQPSTIKGLGEPT
jgi:hypothetical protein